MLPLAIWVVLKTGTHRMETIDHLGPMVQNPDGSPDSVYHKVGKFAFTNQLGQTITQDSLKGNIVIAGLFLSDGPSTAPKILRAQRVIQDRAKDDPNVKLLSFSITPEKDSVAVLAKKAEEYGAIEGKWHFLTGKKEQIWEFVRNQLYLKVYEGEGGELGFVYANELRLIDQAGELRGSWNYDATHPTMTDSVIIGMQLLEVEFAQAEKDKK